MNGATRRRLLAGASAGGALLSTLVWASDRDPIGTTAGSTGASLDVTITEIEVCSAGSRLDVTATVENTGTSDVRTDVTLLVGEEGERVGSVRTTIEAGETREISHGYDTYPTPTDSEFPVRMVAGAGVDERTVSVSAAGSLSIASPDQAVTVEPETAVLFEVGGDEVENAQSVVWWIDGDRVGGGFGGPWQATYEAETGRRYWFEEFDTVGTYEVAAAIVPEDGEDTAAAYWTVEVRDGGNRAPSIDRVDPSAGTLSYRRGDTATFEVSVTDPDGGLDRVVWWLTQADVILDVTELAGDSDTATLSVDADRLCFTCQVRPWVIATDGTITSLTETWQIGELIERDDADGRDGQ